MIRINLSSLAPTKAKRGGGAKRAPTVAMPSVSIPGEGPSSVVMILVFLIAVLGGIGFTYWWANQRTTRLQADLQKAIAENQRLAEVKARYEAQKKKSDSFERRLKVIDDLKLAQQHDQRRQERGFHRYGAQCRRRCRFDGQSEKNRQVQVRGNQRDCARRA